MLRAATHQATDDLSRAILSEADVVQACTDVYSDRIDRAADLVTPTSAAGFLRPSIPGGGIGEHRRASSTSNLRLREGAEGPAVGEHLPRRRHGPFAGVYGRCFAGIAAFAQLDLMTAVTFTRTRVDLACRDAGPHSHAARLAGALRDTCGTNAATSTAQKNFSKRVMSSVPKRVADFMIATYISLARIRALRGDHRGGLVPLDEGWQSGRHVALPRLSAAVAHERVRAGTCPWGRSKSRSRPRCAKR